MKISTLLVAFVLTCTFSCTGNKEKNDHGHEHNDNVHEHAHGDHSHSHDNGEAHTHTPAEQEEFTLNDSAQRDTVQPHNHNSAHEH